MSKLLPINKRWPGKWVIKATLYTPTGTKMDIETDLPDKVAEKIMGLVSFALQQPELPSRRYPVSR